MHCYQVNLLKDPDHPGPNFLLDYVRETLAPILAEEGLTVSRQPPEEARENYMRRQALTLQAHPIATRLVQVTS